MRRTGWPWLQDRPLILEAAYSLTRRLLQWASPLLSKVGRPRLNAVFIPLEEITKKPVFGCRMCGQCILHSTGMTCPMTCPKELRNGPCGGVRQNGHCEVIPSMPCVWVKAWERSSRMGEMGAEILLIQPPVNRSLHGTSAWLNLLTGENNLSPAGWQNNTPNL